MARKILVTGGNGQLGLALKDVLKNENILLTDTDNMEITDPVQIEGVFSDFRPTHLVHGAAYTNVDGCEENPSLAWKVNAEGTKNLAKACKKHNCQMLYISTDYVFDGTKTEPYTEDDETNPQSVYGKTKLEGEKHTLQLPDSYVIRTQWVYGEGKNFIRTMLALSEKMDVIKVVNDQFGRPTYAPDLAKAIYDVIKKRPEPGIYNVTGDGPVVSWADFAEEIFKIADKKTRVVGILTSEYLILHSYNKIAPRPTNSSLTLTKTLSSGIFVKAWNKSISIYLRGSKL